MIRGQKGGLAPPAADPSPDEGDRIAAIGLVVLATCMFSFLDATAKYLVLSQQLPIGQIVWLRFFVQFLGMAFLIPALGLMSLSALFRTNALGLQITRSLFLALTTVFNFLAFQYLQLDQTISIMFLAPLMIALVAGPLLGEWVGWRRFVAILVGFAGIVIVVRPGMGFLHVTGAMFSFTSMSALVGFILLTRLLAQRDPALVTLFYSLLAGVLLGAPYAWMIGVWPSDALTWCLLLAMGLFGGVGHYLFILAYERAPASYLSPFLYAQIMGMVTLGYFVFGDLPDELTLLGSLIVILSGLYLYHREQVKRKAIMQERESSARL